MVRWVVPDFPASDHFKTGFGADDLVVAFADEFVRRFAVKSGDGAVRTLERVFAHLLELAAAMEFVARGQLAGLDFWFGLYLGFG